MATRKFLFMNQSEGYSQEQAASDQLELGKVTLAGIDGVAVDAGGQLISNVGQPASANDAARKVDVTNAQAAAEAYTDQEVAAEAEARDESDNALAERINLEAAARIAADDTLQDNIDAEQAARIAADNDLQDAIDAEEAARLLADQTLGTAINNEATARTNADNVLAQDITDEENARIAADQTLQNNINNEANIRLLADGVLQDNIDAEAAARLSADQTLQQNIDNEETARISADNTLRTDFEAADELLEADYIARDVVVLDSAKAYADSLLSGFIVKEPAKAIVRSDSAALTGLSAVDGVSIVAGDRILVARETASVDNGVYVAAAGAWTRSTDMDASADFKDGVSVFVEQGTQYADSTWVLITNNPIVMGTTPVAFVQFSGLGQITAGEGLSKTGNTLDVNVGSGIHISADAVAVDLSTTPGLQFESGKLAAKPDAARGLDKDASGLYVTLGSTGMAPGLGFNNADGGLYVKTYTGLNVGENGVYFMADGVTIDSNMDGTQGVKLEAGQGLKKTNGLAIDLATDPALQFTNGKLEVKVDVNRALAKDADGAYVAVMPTGAIVATPTGLGFRYNSQKALTVNGINQAEVVADESKALTIDATAGLQVKADSASALAINPMTGLQVVADEAEGLVIDATEGLQVKYDSSKALAMDAAAGLQVVADTSKAISVSASGVALELATDPGLQFTGGKLDHKLVSADRLVKGADGLDVTGVPSLFKIGGSAVGANVTAANLTTLTSGSATALHSHPSMRTMYLSGQAISAGRCVYVSGASSVSTASCSAPATARVIGVAFAASALGAQASVVMSGTAAIPGASFTVGAPYYLGSDGSLVEFSALASGDRVIRVGFATTTAGGFHVAIQDMGAKA